MQIGAAVTAALRPLYRQFKDPQGALQQQRPQRPAAGRMEPTLLLRRALQWIFNNRSSRQHSGPQPASRQTASAAASGLAGVQRGQLPAARHRRFGGGRVCAAVLVAWPLTRRLPARPLQIGEDIAKETAKEWKGLRVTVKLTVQNRQVGAGRRAAAGWGRRG